MEGEGPFGPLEARGLKAVSKTLFVCNGSLEGSSRSRRAAAVCVCRAAAGPLLCPFKHLILFLELRSRKSRSAALPWHQRRWEQRHQEAANVAGLAAVDTGREGL